MKHHEITCAPVFYFMGSVELSEAVTSAYQKKLLSDIVVLEMARVNRLM